MMIKFQVSRLNDNVEGSPVAWISTSKNTDCGWGERTVSWLSRTEVPKFLFINLNHEEQTTVTSWALVS